jgi:hypothetical protein
MKRLLAVSALKSLLLSLSLHHHFTTTTCDFKKKKKEKKKRCDIGYYRFLVGGLSSNKAIDMIK